MTLRAAPGLPWDPRSTSSLRWTLPLRPTDDSPEVQYAQPGTGTPGSPAPPRGRYTPKADGPDPGAPPSGPGIRIPLLRIAGSEVRLGPDSALTLLRPDLSRAAVDVLPPSCCNSEIKCQITRHWFPSPVMQLETLGCSRGSLVLSPFHFRRPSNPDPQRPGGFSGGQESSASPQIELSIPPPLTCMSPTSPSWGRLQCACSHQAALRAKKGIWGYTFQITLLHCLKNSLIAV